MIVPLRILSGLGFLVSLYFALIYFGLKSRWISKEICTKGRCSNIITRKIAFMFNVPNFFLGLIYYTLIFISTFFIMDFNTLYLLLVMAWIVMMVSVYLTYLLVKTRQNCYFCFAAHIINMAIAFLLFIVTLQNR